MTTANQPDVYDFFGHDVTIGALVIEDNWHGFDDAAEWAHPADCWGIVPVSIDGNDYTLEIMTDTAGDVVYQGADLDAVTKLLGYKPDDLEVFEDLLPAARDGFQSAYDALLDAAKTNRLKAKLAAAPDVSDFLETLYDDCATLAEFADAIQRIDLPSPYDVMPQLSGNVSTTERYLSSSVLIAFAAAVSSLDLDDLDEDLRFVVEGYCRPENDHDSASWDEDTEFETVGYVVTPRGNGRYTFYDILTAEMAPEDCENYDAQRQLVADYVAGAFQ